jgi:hypothetical protein
MEGGGEAQTGRSELKTIDEALEGGAVEPLQDYPIAEQHQANTARYLAYALVATLALSVLFGGAVGSARTKSLNRGHVTWRYHLRVRTATRLVCSLRHSGNAS